MTGAEALRAATARLSAAGVACPARDARRLLAHALGLGDAPLAGALPETLPERAAAAVERAVAARTERRPMAQILGRRAFYGRDFAVTEAVLDPRPETETLVAHALEAPFAHVLDLGTGSGCILIALLAERGAATGLGTEVSAAALDVAQRNARAHDVGERARFVRSDWFSAVEGRFDLVVANPPYIAAGELPALAPELGWEPALALSPGPDPLAAHRAIAETAPRHLSAEGRLLVEIGAGQAAAVAGILAAAGLSVVAARADLDGRTRTLAARAREPRPRRVSGEIG